MGSSLRQSGMQAVNFFFLVDIFTCVLGILILVTLMWATQANTSATGRPTSTVLEQARQQELTRLLGDLSRLNAQNELQQRSVTAAESAPGLAGLQLEIDDLTQANTTQRQRQGALQDKIQRSEQAGAKRDDVLGLTDLRLQVEKLREEISGVQPLLDKALADMKLAENKVKDTDADLLAAKSLRDKLWLIPDLSQTTKEPLLVTVAERVIRIERFNKPSETILILHTHSEDEFKAKLKRYDSLNYYTVFYVKPSGIPIFEKIREIAKDANFEVGYDAIEEGKEIVFSKRE